MKSLKESLLDDDILDKTDISKAIKNILSSVPEKIRKKPIRRARSKTTTLYYYNWNSEDFSTLVPGLKRISFYVAGDEEVIHIQFFNNTGDDLTDDDRWLKNGRHMIGINVPMQRFKSPYNKSGVKDKILMLNKTINLFKDNMDKLFNLYNYIKNDLDKNRNRIYVIPEYKGFYQLEKLFK